MLLCIGFNVFVVAAMAHQLQRVSGPVRDLDASIEIRTSSHGFRGLAKAAKALLGLAYTVYGCCSQQVSAIEDEVCSSSSVC